MNYPPYPKEHINVSIRAYDREDLMSYLSRISIKNSDISGIGISNLDNGNIHPLIDISFEIDGGKLQLSVPVYFINFIPDGDSDE